jgi:hypothetical protein
MTDLSIARFTMKPDKVALEFAVLQPAISNLHVTLDELWMAQHPEAWPSNMESATNVGGIRFLDATGSERTSMRRLVQDPIREFGQAGQTPLKAEFSDPTYISGIELLNKDGIPVGNLKIVSLTCTLDITMTTVASPMFSSPTTTYLIKNAIENDHRYALIAEHGSELAAVVSVRLRSSRIACPVASER